MNAAALASAIEQAIAYLGSVGETQWSRRLSELRSTVDADPGNAARELMDALPELGQLYLTTKSGHDVSRAQEMPCNMKLSALRQQLYFMAEKQLAEQPEQEKAR
ncbi:MAG TPA: hypothetical protein VEC19_06775 [Usitatibacter sp.]|nr:hypothetical protein [Usitatibacter sp.]